MAWLPVTLAACFGASGVQVTVPLVRNNQAELPLTLVDGVGHVPMTGCAGFDYLASFNLGGQPLHLLVDSGSATLAVAAYYCSTCGVTNGYRPSTTSKNTRYTASSVYLDGSQWSGNVMQEEVAAGDGNALATPPVSVSIVAVSKEKGFFETVSCQSRGDTDFEGIIGMGPDAQLEGNTTSLLSQLHRGGRLAQDVFAIQTCDSGGNLWLGGTDAASMAGAPQYTPLIPVGATANRNNAYAVNILQMALGGVDFGLAPASLGPMVVDNGTSVIILTPDAYAAFTQILENHPVYQQNFGSGFLAATHAACQPAAAGLSRDELDAQLPHLSFVFPRADGTSFTIDLPASKSYLVAGVHSGDAPDKVVYCPAVTSGSQLAIIGNVAMRDHIVIFDREQQQVGFAPQVGCTSSSLYLPAGT